LQSVHLVVMECIPFHCAPRCTTGRSATTGVTTDQQSSDQLIRILLLR
jgi:hypothetical protein